jgi:malonate transporter and related proteins
MSLPWAYRASCFLFDDGTTPAKGGRHYLDLMAAAVGPAALFAVGLSLVGRKLVGNIGEVLWLAVLKAVINPILTLARHLRLCDGAVVVTGSRYSLGDARGHKPLRHRAAIPVSPTIVISTVMSVVTVFFVLVCYGVG